MVVAQACGSFLAALLLGVDSTWLGNCFATAHPPFLSLMPGPGVFRSKKKSASFPCRTQHHRVASDERFTRLQSVFGDCCSRLGISDLPSLSFLPTCGPADQRPNTREKGDSLPEMA